MPICILWHSDNHSIHNNQHIQHIHHNWNNQHKHNIVDNLCNQYILYIYQKIYNKHKNDITHNQSNYYIWNKQLSKHNQYIYCNCNIYYYLVAFIKKYKSFYMKISTQSVFFFHSFVTITLSIKTLCHSFSWNILLRYIVHSAS